jgi:hypothetical protein
MRQERRSRLARWAVAAVAASSFLSFGPRLGAEDAVQPQRVPALHVAAASLASLPAVGPGLSPEARSFLALAARWSALEARVPRSEERVAAATPAPSLLSAGRISDPSLDVSRSGLAGFTQDDGRLAWCGPNVVAAYRDTGSLLETALLGTVGVSAVGLSRSASRGARYVDLGRLDAGPDPAVTLFGAPVVGCSDASTFYVATLQMDARAFSGGGSGAAVSKSTDGGATWGPPVAAVMRDAASHFVDSPWLAVDPAHPGRVYLAFSGVDSGVTCGGTFVGHTIEVAGSTDGGATWSTPTLVRAACDGGGGALATGAEMAVDGSGVLYVAGLLGFGAGRAVFVDKSVNAGLSFKQLEAFTVTGPGGTFGGSPILQGGFAIEPLPALAIDRSGGQQDGAVYLAWPEGSLLMPDATAGVYAFADVLLIRSTDAGATWSRSPARVNNAPEPTLGFGVGADQFGPALAVDRTGALAACFYDRRRDVRNFLTDLECARSADGGIHWTNVRRSVASWTAGHGQDQLLGPADVGLEVGLAADFLNLTPGFRGAYSDGTAGNADLKAFTN